MKDITVLVLTTIFSLAILFYVNKIQLQKLNELDKEVLDLSIPVSGTIDVEYLRTNIKLPNE